MRGSELEKREAKNESDRRSLSEEIEKVRSLVLEWNDSCMHILMFWHEH